MTTKIIAASKLRGNLSDSLDAIEKDDVLIITRRGKSERAVIDIDMLEDLLAASDPEYLKDIQRSRQQIDGGEVYSLDEVFGNL